jgi:DNA-binding NtrC family response regulator
MKDKPQILIVDSEIANLTFCKTTLESNGYSVLTAQHAEDGINIYRQQQNYICVIFLNLQLSGKTYFFSIPAFFAINKNAKIVAMSDAIELHELSAYNQTKLSGFIKKPIQEKILINCLERLVKIKS